DHIEFTRSNSASRLPPGTPFKCYTKDIVKGGQNLAPVVIFKNPTKAPGIYTIEPRRGDDFDSVKRGLFAAHGGLVLGTNDERHCVTSRQGFAMGVPNERPGDSIRVTTWS